MGAFAKLLHDLTRKKDIPHRSRSRSPLAYGEHRTLEDALQRLLVFDRRVT
jgi:hypothetical protein